jgi:hypothetical protein
MNGLDEMLEAIKYGDPLVNGGNVDEYVEIAKEWVRCKFSAEEANEWWDAHVWCASAAKTLQDACIMPDDIREEEVEIGGLYYNLGQAYSNCDISLEEVKEVIALNS